MNFKISANENSRLNESTWSEGENDDGEEKAFNRKLYIYQSFLRQRRTDEQLAILSSSRIFHSKNA